MSLSFDNIDNFNELLKLFGVYDLFKDEQSFLNMKNLLESKSIKKRNG